MYVASKEIKKDPKRRWSQKDRAFFGRGACGILAGTYLRMFPEDPVWGEMIIPIGDFGGNHIYVTDGKFAFDYRGYCSRNSLITNHHKGWRRLNGADWGFRLARVEFDLLSTRDMNAHKMLGPDQYLHDPVLRAEDYIRAKQRNCEKA